MTNRTAHVPNLLRRLVRTLPAFVLAATTLTLTPRLASAQEWLKDRRYQEGAGIRVGDLEVHPGIGGEVGYDSNWFLRTHKTDPRFVNGAPQNPPDEGGIIRITPSVTIGTLTQQRQEGVAPTQPPTVNFRAGIAATYREFLGSEELRDQRNLSGNAFARADIFQNRPLGFGVFANYQRLIQPSVVSDPNRAFNRSDVGAGAEVIAIPGGGTLDVRAGYQFMGAFFEQNQGVPFTNFTHEVSIKNRWRFRPRTALFHDTSLRFINYPNAERALTYLNDSTPLRSRIGVTGLLTDRFGVLLAAGYGATFFSNGGLASTQQYDSVNAQAEGTFYLSQSAGQGEPGQATLLLSTLSFGYMRDFQNSLLGNFYESNKGYAKVVYFYGGKLLLQLDGYFEALGYPQPFYNTPAGPQPVVGANGLATGDFTNYRVGGTFYTEYRFTDAFAVTGTVDYQQVISDTPIAASAGGVAGGLFDLNWRRVQALVGARYFF
jgi:hypothetical protein